ncbi:unnamed protein product [Aphanomyces euteiches]
MSVLKFGPFSAVDQEELSRRHFTNFDMLDNAAESDKYIATALCSMSVASYAYCTTTAMPLVDLSRLAIDRDAQKFIARHGTLTMRAHKSAAGAGLVLGCAVGMYELAALLVM